MNRGGLTIKAGIWRRSLINVWRDETIRLHNHIRCYRHSLFARVSFGDLLALGSFRAIAKNTHFNVRIILSLIASGNTANTTAAATLDQGIVLLLLNVVTWRKASFKRQIRFLYVNNTVPLIKIELLRVGYCTFHQVWLEGAEINSIKIPGTVWKITVYFKILLLRGLDEAIFIK